MDTELNPNDININIDNYRRLVKQYMNLHLYNAALYWADKVVALSKAESNDIYWMAQCMYLLKQYHRAAHLIRSRGLEKTHLLCHYLIVKCLFEAGEMADALTILDSVEANASLFQNSTQTKFNDTFQMNENPIFEETPRNQVQASIFLLKGRIYEALDNRGMATDCYKQALQYDVYCFEAFEALVQHQMLTSQEETELLESLPVVQQCTTSEAYILKFLYEKKLRKYHATCKISETESLPFLTALNSSQNERTRFTTGGASDTILPRDQITLDINIPLENIMISKNVKLQNMYNMKKSNEVAKNSETIIDKLQRSLDLAVSVAEKYYYNCQYTYCIKITEAILKTDPFHSQCLPVHIACLVDLKESNKLFYLAHRLVALYPDLAIAWFAVGCYYYVIGKSDPARRYLSKATTLDRLFGPAWLAYGHSFAVENEHDQAMAAYFKASQLMKGCHLPLLYIGLECGLTNNERLAEKFFQQARAIAPEDPFVMHEMGVIAFQNLDYKTAEKHFRDALARVTSTNGSILVEKWEPLLNNLGHTCRKRKKYWEAIEFHKQALTVAPQNAATYSALGYVQALLGRTQEAVESFHKALGLRKNDTFSITMLRLVVDELLEETPPFEGAPEQIPDFEMIASKPSSLDRTLSDVSGVVNDIVADSPVPATPVPNENVPVNNTCLSDMSMSFD